MYAHSKREKKIGRIFALRKKVFKFALLFRSLHTVSPQNTQLCSNFMSIRLCCFVFTYGRYWCFGSFNNKLIECCWWVHNNNRNTLPIHLVLSSAWCIFPFFSDFNVEIIAILHLQRGNIPRCCVDTSSNLSEERKKPTQKRLRQFSGLVIWHTILRIVRECGWGFSCEFKHVLLWIIDQISRHSIPKISHLPTNTCVAFERCFAVASSHKNAAPSIWSDGAAYAEHTVRVFRNKSPTNRPWAWNLEDSRIREARASQPANVFALILSLCVFDTFPTIARSSAFARCYFLANFYDAHHQYHLRISFFFSHTSHCISTDHMNAMKTTKNICTHSIPYVHCKRNADTLQFNHYH